MDVSVENINIQLPSPSIHLPLTTSSHMDPVPLGGNLPPAPNSSHFFCIGHGPLPGNPLQHGTFEVGPV